MITRAKFQNFKALRDVEITFDSRLTVLVGPNGRGKTSVLQGIDLLSRSVARVRREQEIDLTPQQIKAYFTKQPLGEQMVCEASANARDGTFHLQVIAKPRNQPKKPKPDLFDTRVMISQTPLDNPPLWTPAGAGATLDGIHRLFDSLLLKLNARRLANPSDPANSFRTVASDGAGLASFVATLSLNQPDSFRKLVSALRAVVPIVEGIRLDREIRSRNEVQYVRINEQNFPHQTTTRYVADVLLFDFPHASGVPAEQVSEGTILTLGLLAMLSGESLPAVILLDDLDQALHPKAQMELIGVLRRILDQYPSLQIIATSHSPYILSKLEWNEVRVTGFKDDGSAICARLEDHPEVERWREAMTPGEFWSHAGDDWVKKLDKPQPAVTAP